MKKTLITFATLAALSLTSCLHPHSDSEKGTVMNDSNTPLHLLQPEYNIPYGLPDIGEVKENMDRVLHYLQKSTPTRVVDKASGKVITD